LAGALTGALEGSKVFILSRALEGDLAGDIVAGALAGS